ncbi:tetratricopeptide repeat protein [Roseiterribacter gracilis]|uniref:Protein FlbA n=1 Tax=Roseiterribacter gracilis TaxID=2812848 RepID=A0A8S8XIK3_9PROT|nr:protein FlbA [Rhodospirillales bacterium TMPK1]
MSNAEPKASLFEFPMPASIKKSLAAGDISPALFAILREGQSFLDASRPDLALDKFQEAYDLSGDNPFTLRVIGAFLYSIGQYKEALSIYLRLQELVPSEVDVLHSIGAILYAMREFEPAMEMVRGLLEQHPTEPTIWLTAGLIAAELALWTEGRIFLEYARDLSPDDPAIRMNLGWLERCENKLEAAAAEYAVAMALAPGNVSIRFNQALVLLGLGDFAAGWEAYEARTVPASHAYVNREINVPVWDGKKRLRRERVLIGAEQGIGDQLHFTPDLPHLLADVENPTLEIHAKLVKLFKRTYPDLDVRPQLFRKSGDVLFAGYPWIEEEGIQFDTLMNIGSLPLYAWRKFGNWPARPTRMLQPDPEKVARFEERLRAFGDKPKVGFVWRSQLYSGARAEAYAAPARYRNILRDLGDATLISLQYSEPDETIEFFRNEFGVEVHHFHDIDHIDDLDTVAALISTLDFTFGAKTAPLMLGAAVGTPSLAIHGASPWVAQLPDGFDPWMPAFAQATGITWDHAFEEAESILRDWLAKALAGQPIAPHRTEPFFPLVTKR